jgi:hypothetical protein
MPMASESSSSNQSTSFNIPKGKRRGRRPASWALEQGPRGGGSPRGSRVVTLTAGPIRPSAREVFNIFKIFNSLAGLNSGQLGR